MRAIGARLLEAKIDQVGWYDAAGGGQQCRGTANTLSLGPQIAHSAGCGDHICSSEQVSKTGAGRRIRIRGAAKTLSCKKTREIVVRCAAPDHWLLLSVLVFTCAGPRRGHHLTLHTAHFRDVRVEGTPFTARVMA